MDKVQDVTCKFGIWGRIFGFGDLEIESAGTYGKIIFDFAPNPRKLQEKIERAISLFASPSVTLIREILLAKINQTSFNLVAYSSDLKMLI